MGMIKTEKEIRLLRKSAKISDSCIKVIEDSLKEEVTERELKRRIERKIKSLGATLAFNTIVASGRRSASMHTFKETNRVIKGLGYADFGASYKGYKTDVTVPFVKGKLNKEERRIVDITIRAYKVATSSVVVGQPCWKLFQKIFTFMKENGVELKHRLGHGLGLRIHEYPFIVIPGKEKIKRSGSERKMFDWDIIKKMNFEKNMVFTIEPGVYVDGIGGCRLENDFIITANGPKALTHSRLIEV